MPSLLLPLALRHFFFLFFLDILFFLAEDCDPEEYESDELDREEKWLLDLDFDLDLECLDLDDEEDEETGEGGETGL